MTQTTEIKLVQVAVNPDNPRTITKEKFDKLVDSILVFPKMLQLRPVVVDAKMVALGGNMRTEALNAIAQMTPEELSERLVGIADYQRKTKAEQDALVAYWGKWLDNPTVYIVKADNLSEQEREQFIIKDNTQFGTWDYDALSSKWDSELLNDWGMDVWPDKQEGDINLDSFFNEENGAGKKTSKPVICPHCGKDINAPVEPEEVEED